MSKRIIKIVIISAIIFGLVLLFLVVNGRNLPNPLSNNPGESISKFNGVQPGVSSRKDVKEKLQNPKKDYIKEEYNVWEFDSDNPNYNNEFYFENDRLVFVKQIIVKKDSITADQLKAKYKTPEHVLYGTLSHIGTNLYVYPESGVAYLAHGKSGIVFEIWYFEPTDLKSFKDKWGKEYFYQFIEKPDRIY